MGCHGMNGKRKVKILSDTVDGSTMSSRLRIPKCYLIKNSSLLLPFNHNGARPRPVHVAPLTGSRYFAATGSLALPFLVFAVAPRSAADRPYCFIISAICAFAFANSFERTASACLCNSAICAWISAYVDVVIFVPQKIEIECPEFNTILLGTLVLYGSQCRDANQEIPGSLLQPSIASLVPWVLIASAVR